MVQKIRQQAYINTIYNNHSKQQYLWSNVVWSTTECVGSSCCHHAFLAHTKVSELAVAVSIKQNVVKFQITTTVQHRVS